MKLIGQKIYNFKAFCKYYQIALKKGLLNYGVKASFISPMSMLRITLQLSVIEQLTNASTLYFNFHLIILLNLFFSLCYLYFSFLSQVAYLPIYLFKSQYLEQIIKLISTANMKLSKLFINGVNNHGIH